MNVEGKKSLIFFRYFMHTNKLQFTNRESQVLTYYVPSVLQTLEFYNNIVGIDILFIIY